MARKLVAGGDVSDPWVSVLNDWLAISHDADGTLLTDAVESALGGSLTAPAGDEAKITTDSGTIVLTAGGFYGFGTDTPNFPLRFEITTAGSVIAPTRPVVDSRLYTVAPAAAPGVLTDYHGLDLAVVTSGANLNDNIRLYGFESTVQHATAAQIKQIVPTYSHVQVTAAATVDEVRMHRIALDTGSAGSTVTSFNGSRIEAVAGTGTVGDFFGYRVEDSTAKATGQYYAFYADAGASYFGGNVETGGAVVLSGSVASPGGTVAAISNGGAAGKLMLNAAGTASMTLCVNNAALIELRASKLAFFNGTTVTQPAITGALSTVSDAAAKAVLTSIIAALKGTTGVNLVTDGTT